MFQNFKNAATKNWITSVIGLLIIILQIGLCILNGGNIIECVQTNWESLLAAIALIFARDFTGDKKPQQLEQQN